MDDLTHFEVTRYPTEKERLTTSLEQARAAFKQFPTPSLSRSIQRMARSMKRILHSETTPTVADLAALNERAGEKYFARDTLKFFGQRRSDFSVCKPPTPEPGVFKLVGRGSSKVGLSKFNHTSSVMISSRTGETWPVNCETPEKHKSAPAGRWG